MDSQRNIPWTEIMLWHLNKFRNTKQGVNISKTYIPNTNWGRKQKRFYRDLLTAWTDLMNNQKVDPTTLSEIYNEQLFFNASSITHNNQFEYLMKIPTPWARERFWMVGDICKKNAPGFISMGELLSTNAQKTFRYGPKSKDLT